jgi:murein DD-endopeptidase MepM/ murein hydrolase activator NlpD
LADCGWTRLAYLLFALTILIALAQVGSPSADPRSLASKPPDRATVEENPPAAEGVVREQTVQHEGATHTAFPDHDEGDHRSTAIVDGAPSAAESGPPLFYRPAPASPTQEQGGGVGSGPVCSDLGAFPSNRTLAFPLPRKYLDSYEDTWGAPRPQGGHEGTDLMAPTGTAEYAVTDGTIVPVAGANENGWNTLGGYTVMLRADYSVGPVKEGDLFYYAHLERESALEIGTRVRVGQTIGYAGDTGQGPEVTRGLFPPHLHFGWYDASGARSTTTSGAMNPYPLLEWIKANGGAITGGSYARYCEAPRTGGPVPSAGESRWPAPDAPGVSPDLVTGMHQPAPGPATAGPAREIGHTGGAAPAQRKLPAPDQSPPDAPEGTAPKTDPRTTGPSSSDSPTPPRAEPRPDSSSSGDEPPETSDGEGAEDDPDAPTSGAHPEGDEANDPPDDDAQGENEGDGTDTPEEPGEEPESKGPEEDSQPPGEQTSPGEDQYAPEAGGESDPETTAAE